MAPPHTRRLRARLIASVLTCLVVVAIAAGFILRGLSDFDLSDRYVEDLTFEIDGNRLSGTLVLPDEQHYGPIAIIVHGDGAQNRFSSDAYLPLINALLDHGIGIYSWDKAGVGQSTGNWLDQSMMDRAIEAKAAFDMISATRPGQQDQIGLFGFSQAGWVIPKASPMIANNAFNVIVGGAVNWQDQGAYYTRQRLLGDGVNAANITAKIADNRKQDAITFAPDASYDDYLASSHDANPMSKERFEFVQRNINADATSDLTQLMAPTLAVFGKDDLNVDALGDEKIYRTILNHGHADSTTMLVPNATHGLLRAGLFNYQLASEMPVTTRLLFMAMGRYAYAPGILDEIADWVTNTIVQD